MSVLVLAVIEVTGGTIGVGALITTLLTLLSSIGVWMVRTLGKTSEERDKSSDAGWKAYRELSAQFDTRLADLSKGGWEAVRDQRIDYDKRVADLAGERDYWRDKFISTIDSKGHP